MPTTEQPKRRLRYQVAASLDGFIAGPNGEFDWIPDDPDIDFGAHFAQFDTLVMGSKTFLVSAAQGGGGGMPGMKSVVFSRTLKQADYKKVTILADDPVETVRVMKDQPGKDIWLFGGGAMFRTLLAGGLVDTVEPAVVPVLLGEGVPLLPSPLLRTKLALTSHRLYQKSGIVLMEYDVVREPKSRRKPPTRKKSVK